MSTNSTLLRIQNLKKYFPVKKGFLKRSREFLRAVDDVTFTLEEGKTLGLVGESGCGKTTLGRLIVRLLEPTQGSIFFRDSPDLAQLENRKLLPYRRKIQMIFQDPFSSLNPRSSVGAIVGEALTIHNLARGRQKDRRIRELLNLVGLKAEHAELFPHEFSGGQRQRIGIARALSVQPDIIIADEPVSALDVSIQAQIINLLKKLQDAKRIAYLFISHDLSVVGYISHRIAVMYLGRIVEIGDKEHILNHPLHPYTEALLQAVPRIDPRDHRKRIMLKGDVPSPIHPPTGCPFHPRCPKRFDACDKAKPLLREQEQGHWVSCLLYGPES